VAGKILQYDKQTTRDEMSGRGDFGRRGKGQGGRRGEGEWKRKVGEERMIDMKRRVESREDKMRDGGSEENRRLE
jgi:hypothetical protein